MISKKRVGIFTDFLVITGLFIFFLFLCFKFKKLKIFFHFFG